MTLRCVAGIVNQLKFGEPHADKSIIVAYDEKYRAVAIEFKDIGHTFEELRDAFGIDDGTYYRWKTIKNATGNYVQNRQNYGRENGK